MPAPPTHHAFAGWLLYEDDELILDGDDPSTYIVCETADDIRRALATLAEPHDPQATAR